MASLRNLLPEPTQTLASSLILESESDCDGTLPVKKEKSLYSHIPEYGDLLGWMPRNLEDYGDGGAYPEIQVVQYPLDMGRQKQEKSNALPLKLDASGKIKYGAFLKQGTAKDNIVYHKLQNLLPYGITADEEEALKRPDEEDLRQIPQYTKKALEMLTQCKISAAMPIHVADKQGTAQHIRYTPAQQGSEFNSGADQIIIRVVETQKDPLEPSKFKINKKILRGPPSPPAPVMHSPRRKVTVQEQKDWKIPPCVSNWKNLKGYTIPLDKHLAADGRGLQQTHINENFSRFAEAVYLADRKARHAVEARAKLEWKVAAKEKEKKEEHLRLMALRARDERAGLETHADQDEDDEVRERDQLREERHRNRHRERNIARAAPERKYRLERQRKRDISEQISLGIPSSSSKASEVQFDQRLFKIMSKGLDSGFGLEDDYTVYDKPWRPQQRVSHGLYRPSRDKDNAEDLDKMVKTSRFVPEKYFAGLDRTACAKRDGPVQFEKVQEDEDPFGLDKFFNEAKKASKRRCVDDIRCNKQRRH